MSEQLSGDGFALARYNADGSLDMNFGTLGTTLTRPGGWAEAIVLQPDGRILAGRSIWAGSDDDYNFGLVRYRRERLAGQPASARGGIAASLVRARVPTRAYALALQPNGRVVAAGVSSPQGSY